MRSGCRRRRRRRAPRRPSPRASSISSRMRSRAASSTTGPIIVPWSRGSPTTSFRARSASLAAELAGHGAVGDDALGRHADLAGVHERAEARGVGGGLEVGIGEDHLRRLAAELEQAALEVLGALRRDDPADPRRAGEVHAADRRMRDQLVDDVGRVACRMDDQVDRARGQARVARSPARRRRACAGSSPTPSGRRCCRTRAGSRPRGWRGSPARSTAPCRRRRRLAGECPSTARPARRRG